MIRVLIADDELLARKRLVRILSEMPEVVLVAACSSGGELIAQLQQHTVDIVLLDIQMPELSGLDTGRFIPNGGASIIYVTAYPEHAIEAFDVGAVDYVMKPVDPCRLKSAIDRAMSRRTHTAADVHLAIETARGIVLLLPSEICHLSYDGVLVTIHCLTQNITTALSLTEMEERLPPESFQRVHRRHILNMSLVDKLVSLSTGGYVAYTRLGDQVPISRQAAREIRKRIK